MRFELVEDEIQPTHVLVTSPNKDPLPLAKSYCQDDAHLEKIRICTEDSCGHFSYCDQKTVYFGST